LVEPPRYPTPLSECTSLAGANTRLWLKHDGVTHPVYGGNKVRKLDALLLEARRTNARRILTFGAAGSHHVLSTALFAAAQGLGTGAILVPQRATPHVIDTLRASIAEGVEVYPASGFAGVPYAFARARRRGDYVVPPGASNPLGTLGYVQAALELALQLGATDTPEPDMIVVPVGSGGTAAGLLAGALLVGLKTRVLGVAVMNGPFARRHVVSLARRTFTLACSLGMGPPSSENKALARDAAKLRGLLGERFALDEGYVGAGYGEPTPEAEHALIVAERELGLTLDLTYTAKAFARALHAMAAPASAGITRSPANLLYWHTLSSASLTPLLERAPPLAALSPAVRALLV
jgi:D-cysteine desulfhydrase